jgi:hypothetical protein
MQEISDRFDLNVKNPSARDFFMIFGKGAEAAVRGIYDGLLKAYDMITLPIAVRISTHAGKEINKSYKNLSS